MGTLGLSIALNGSIPAESPAQPLVLKRVRRLVLINELQFPHPCAVSRPLGRMKNLVNLRGKPSAKCPLLSLELGSGPVVPSVSPTPGGTVSQSVTCPRASLSPSFWKWDRRRDNRQGGRSAQTKGSRKNTITCYEASSLAFGRMCHCIYSGGGGGEGRLEMRSQR